MPGYEQVQFKCILYLHGRRNCWTRDIFYFEDSTVAFSFYHIINTNLLINLKNKSLL